MERFRNLTLVTGFFVFILTSLFYPGSASAAVSVQFAEGTSAGWDFYEPAGQGVLLQTIYGTAQDSAGNITANSYQALSIDKGVAMAFSVPQNIALDKGTFKWRGVKASSNIRFRLYNVTDKGCLDYQHSITRADPGDGGTLLIDSTITTPNPVPYHSEGAAKCTDMIIDFGLLEVTTGEYLIVFDAAGPDNTWGSIVRGNAAQADGMGKYPDGTPLPKQATVTTSEAAGNTYYYELSSTSAASYSPKSYLFAFQMLTTAVINQPPVVEAGANQQIIDPVNSVTLDATVTDDGLPDPPGTVTTLWTQQSGPGTVTFGDENAVDTTATFSDYGTYVLRLTADDGEFTAYDEVTVDYSSGNEAPVVDAGTDATITYPVDSVNLDGTVSDDGKPNPPGAVTTLWSKQSGPGTVTFGNASAVDTTATFSDFGVYVLRLTADDGELSSYDEVTITYRETPPSNQAPVINAGTDVQIVLPNSAILDGTVTDDGLPNPPGVVRSTWTKTSGPGTVTFGNYSLIDTTASFSAAGTYVLRLTADDNELSSYDEVTITVNPEPLPAAILQLDGFRNIVVTGDTVYYGRWEDPNNWYCAANPLRDMTIPILGDTVKLHFYNLHDPMDDPNPAWCPQSHITIDTVGVAKCAKLQAKLYVNSLTILPGADLEVSRNIEWYQDLWFNAHDLYIYGTVNACTDTGQVRIGGEQSGSTNSIYVYGVLNAVSKIHDASIWLAKSNYAQGTMDHDRLYIYETGIVTTDDLLMAPSGDCLIDITTGGKLVIKADEKAKIDGYVAANIIAGDGVLGNVTVTYYADSDETVIQPVGVPLVCAGADQTIVNPVNSVNLDGTVSSGTTLWTKLSGPGTVTFGDTSAVDTTATFSAYGTYILHLEATQNSKTGYDDVTIQYLATAPVPNQAPVVNAGSDQQITLGSNVTLNGAVSDDGLPDPPGVMTATWTMLSGPGTVTFSNANAAVTTASFSASGTYVLRLTASDSELESYGEVTITVIAGSVNQPPVVSAGPDVLVQQPATIATLNGTATDDGLPNPPGYLTITWTQQSGPGTVTFADLHSAATTATASALGTYVLRLTADDGQLTSYDEVTVTWYTYEGYEPIPTGGAGGAVVHVTNRDDSGTGSLRDAVAALSGEPTTIVFDVNGSICVSDEIRIQKDNVTIDGSSAPSPGITLVDNGDPSAGFAVIGIKANNIIINNLRIRHLLPTGDFSAGAGGTQNANKCIIIWNGSRIIIDHCSLTGAGDSAIAMTDSGVDHIIVSRCLLGGCVESFRSHASYCSIHHNLFTMGNRRMPRIYAAGPYVDFRNNVVDYWTNTGTNISGSAAVNVVNNYWTHPYPHYGTCNTGFYVTSYNGVPCTDLYVNGNYSGCGEDIDSFTQVSVPNLEPNITTTDAAAAYASVMSDVGAPPTDAIDQYYLNGGGFNPPPTTCGEGPGPEPEPNSWSETADYYVDGQTGSDGNAGTSSAPWATLSKAVSTATSGKKVLVWGGQTYSGALTFNNSGTSDSPITFKRDPASDTAAIDGDGTINGALYTTSAKYITIDGFTIQNGRYGVYIFGSAVTNWTIKNCRVTGNDLHGIYVRSGKDVSLFNDAVYGNGSSSAGIYFYNSATNDNVTQCDVYKHKYGIEYSTSSSGAVEDSIVTNATSYGVFSSSSTVTITYSDVWSNNIDYSGCSAGTGCISADPLWVNPDSGDFTLGTGSPCIGTASDSGDMGYRGVAYAPGNLPPVVNAGNDQTITLPNSATLDGTVTDDGLPNPPGAVTTTWTKQSGPGTVTFGNANAVDTTASFSVEGVYVLRLTADDSDLETYDEVTITVEAGSAIFYSVDAKDGYVTESSEDSGVGGTVKTTSTYLGDSASRQQRIVFFHFDTSSIPDGATITSATISMRRLGKGGDPTSLGSITVDIKNGYYGTSDSLAAEDFEAPSSATDVATLPYPAANGNWVEGDFNSSGLSNINKTGVTQFKVRFTLKHDNDGTADYLNIYDNGDPPTLEVTWQ